MIVGTYARMVFGSLVLGWCGTASATAISVAATGNMWLAGMPAGAMNAGDTAPANAPTLVTSVAINPGDQLTFSVTGNVQYGPNLPPGGYGPDGGTPAISAQNPRNGIGDLFAPIASLIGLFLDGSQPDSSAEPAFSDMSSLASQNFAVLTPILKSPFFIGDGLTTAAAIQKFVVPAGATRLYLATMDGSGSLNNLGGFNVTIGGAVPEPSAVISVLLAIGSIAAWRKR